MALVAHYPLNGTLDNLVDSTNPLINKNPNSISVNNFGKLDKTYLETAKNRGGLISTKKINLGQTQSMFAWVYVDTEMCLDSHLNAIMGQHRFQHKMGMGLTIKSLTDKTGQISVNTGNGTDRSYNRYCGKTILNVNNWYHLGYTFDGTLIKLYVDGKLDGTFSYPNMLIKEDYFGAFMWSFVGDTESDDPYTGYIGKGKINDIRLYNHTLSQKEVSEISHLKILQYKLNDIYSEPTQNLVHNSDFNPQWTSYSAGYDEIIMTDLGTPGIKINKKNSWCGAVEGSIFIPEDGMYTLSVYCKPIWRTDKHVRQTLYFSGGKYRDVAIDADWNKIGQWQRISMTYDFKAGDSITLYLICYGGDRNTDKISAEYTMPQIEKGEHTTPYTLNIRASDKIIDSSGFNYLGEPNNTHIINDSPCGQYSTYFNGIDSYIKSDYVLKDWKQNEPITFNFWINPEDNENREIFGTPNYSWVIFRNGDGTVGFNQWDTSGGHLNKMGVNSNTKVLLNKWSMVTVAWTGLVSKIYINGQLDNSREASFEKPNKTTTEKMNIGGNIYSWGKKSYFKGSLSNVSIYNDELTDEEILQLYEAKTIIDKSGNIYSSEFKEYGRELFTESFTGDNTHMDPDNFCNVITTGRSWIYYNHGELLEINPDCKYIFKIKVKTAAKNQVDIGFERYDKNKKTGSNNSTFYNIVINTGLDNSYEFDITNAVHENITLLDENKTVVPTKYIKFRGLNNWSSSTNKPDDPDPTYRLEFEASLLEIPINQKTKVNKNGVFNIGVVDDYFLEYEKNKYCYINSPINVNNKNKSKIYKNGIVNGNSFIER